MHEHSGLVDPLPSEAVLRRSIPWRDLGSLSRREIVSELLLPLPWLALSLVAADQMWFVHHLFPAVPTRRLPELARRLDAIDPQLSSKRVF